MNYKLTVPNTSALNLFDFLKEIAANPIYIGRNNRITCYMCEINPADLLSITLKFDSIRADTV